MQLRQEIEHRRDDWIAGYRIGHFGNSQLVGVGNERVTSDGLPRGGINVGLRDWDSLIDSDLVSSPWIASTGSE
jgi:hypothetical protein